MKKALFSTIMILAIVPGAFPQDASVSNCPLATIIQVDGNAEEWPMKWTEDPDKHFSYSVCSDESNLYIRIKSSDETVKRKIGHFGLTVWMDPGGKKKRKLGLRFPTGIEATERMDAIKPPDFQNMTATERTEFKKQVDKMLIGDLEILELIGLADEPLTSTRSGITNGLKVAIAADENEAYVYEAVIPFKSFRMSRASISSLGIGFETGKYVPPPVKGNSGANAPPPGGGFGGSGGGGMYGRSGYGGSGRQYSGSSRGPSSPMSTSTSFWTSIDLK